MDSFKSEGNVASVFEAFGFGALLLFYLWSQGLLTVYLSDAPWEAISGENFALLIASFTIFICFVIGVFAELFGSVVYSSFPRFKTNHLPENEKTILEFKTLSEIDVNEFYRYRKRVEFFQSVLGVALFILIAEITYAYHFSICLLNLKFALVLLSCIIPFLTVWLFELKLKRFVVSRNIELDS